MSMYNKYTRILNLANEGYKPISNRKGNTI